MDACWLVTSSGDRLRVPGNEEEVRELVVQHRESAEPMVLDGGTVFPEHVARIYPVGP